jgi:hypothetical protein
MSSAPIARDERTLAIENASYRLAYIVLTYGLLAAVAYRAFFLEQASWDLMGLVIAAGAITVGYQAFHRVLSRQAMLIGVVAAVVAAAVALLLNLIGLPG